MKTKVASFDLASPAAVWGLDNYRSAWIVVRSGAAVLGILRVGVAGRNGLSAASLRQLARDEFTENAAAPEGPAVDAPVSIVVCTRNRPHSLRRCLHAIGRLDYPQYEVVVVDNGSATN